LARRTGWEAIVQASLNDARVGEVGQPGRPSVVCYLLVRHLAPTIAMMALRTVAGSVAHTATTRAMWWEKGPGTRGGAGETKHGSRPPAVVCC
jgi:hypothetical protein